MDGFWSPNDADDAKVTRLFG